MPRTVRRRAKNGGALAASLVLHGVILAGALSLAPPPAPTVPPPISSQLPGLGTPSGAGPQAGPPVVAPLAPASPAVQATPPAPAAT
nr:hypothetical protein [Phenylobacterium sp.]